LTIVHTFFLFYIKACPYNLFERKPDYIFAIVFLGYLLI